MTAASDPSTRVDGNRPIYSRGTVMFSAIKLTTLRQGIALCGLTLGLAIAASGTVAAGEVAKTAASAQPDAPEREAAALLMRVNFMEVVTKSCANQFPEHATEYTSAFSTWKQSRQPELDQAMMMLLVQGQDALLSPNGDLARSEEANMQNWLKQVGIDMTRPPSAADCSNISQSLQTLH